MISIDNGSTNSKVVLLGNSGTGKTSILQCQLNRSMNETSLPTIGCVYHEVNILVKDENISLKVWDTAGQEIYRSIVPIYVRGSAAAILVYDVSEPASLSSLSQWLSILLEESENVLLYVVGNKIDLTDRYVVEDKEAKHYADSIHASFFKVSAKEAKGVNDLFTAIANDLCGNKNFITREVAEQNQKADGCC
ncbi:hypothetical protein M9Y10_008499 [Tritrichomonas musculus]|uniref:Small GTP-binding protein n=1 Tax=Tritrichomonas musculus TaxID=1915356 RepID=A0ABR2IYA0_9EUKA